MSKRRVVYGSTVLVIASVVACSQGADPGSAAVAPDTRALGGASFPYHSRSLDEDVTFVRDGLMKYVVRADGTVEGMPQFQSEEGRARYEKFGALSYALAARLRGVDDSTIFFVSV